MKQIKGWGDTKQDCVDHLKKNPELKAQGYKVVNLQGTWVIAK